MHKLVEKIYNHSPALIQDLAVTMYGYKVYRREYGQKLTEALKQFEKHKTLSKDEMRAYQEERLAELIEHAYTRVPYYRSIMQERGLTPTDIRTADDLQKLPLLSREDVRLNGEILLADNVSKSDLIIGLTSGTTGSPLSFYFDHRVCLFKSVVDWRQKVLADVNPGDRIAIFLGRKIVPLTKNKPPFWRHNWALNHLLCSSFHLSQDTASSYIAKLRNYRPAALEGYPSTMFILARLLLARNETLPVKAVFTSSESLLPNQREAMQAAFECPVFDFYGMAERVVFATECERHDGKHINEDFGITEVLGKDSQPVARGEMGRIVATGLHNFAMPLIRYVTSDITIMRPEPCCCGDLFPLMENVTTKDEDIITTSDGRYISATILTHPFRPLSAVKEAQIIQEDLFHVRIRMVTRSDYKESDSEYLIQEMKNRFGQSTDVALEFVDEIERTKNGKFRFVISKVSLEF